MTIYLNFKCVEFNGVIGLALHDCNMQHYRGIYVEDEGYVRYK